MRIILDTETTGLDPMLDEILELSVIDADTGEVLHAQRYEPAIRMEWPAAEVINGISPRDVRGCPEIEDDKRIQPLIDQADWIGGWNIKYDLAMLHAIEIDPRGDAEIVDVMQMDAYLCGMITPDHPTGRWRKLATAAEWWGYDLQEGEQYHSSIVDCLATRHVWRSIMHYRERPVSERAPYHLLRHEIRSVMDDIRKIQEITALSMRGLDLSDALSESIQALSAISAMTSAVSTSIDAPGCTSQDIHRAILKSMYRMMWS